jgi:hypothetical protein
MRSAKWSDGVFFYHSDTIIKAIWPNSEQEHGAQADQLWSLFSRAESVDLTPCVVFKLETFLKRLRAHRPRTVPRVRPGWRSDHIGVCVHTTLLHT